MHASIGTMSGCLLNIALDPVFILPWGLNMGAEGAGLATFLSNCVACLYFFALLAVKRGNTFVCIQPKMFRFKKEIVLGVFGVGLPASIQNLLNVTGMTILNNFTSSFGANAVAAMGIAQKINQVPFYIVLGSSQGIMPLVSYTYSSRRIDRMKRTILFTLRTALCVMVAVTIFYSFAADSLIRMFMDNPTIIEYGTRFLRGMCLAIPFLCIDFVAVGVFQAVGMGREALIFRHFAQDRAGDSRAVYPQLAVPALRPGLRANVRGNRALCCRDIRAHAPVPPLEGVARTHPLIRLFAKGTQKHGYKANRFSARS